MGKTVRGFAPLAFLLIHTLSGTAAPAEEEFVVWLDTAGDMTRPITAEAGPAKPLSHFDIRRLLVVDEDERTITIALEVGAIAEASLPAVPLYEITYKVQFRLASEDVFYEVGTALDVMPSQGNPVEAYALEEPVSWFCATTAPGECRLENRIHIVDATVHPERNQVVWHLPKRYLRGLSPEGFAETTPLTDLPRGANLTDFDAFSYYQECCNDAVSLILSDSAPDDDSGKPYSLRTGTESTRLLLRLADGQNRLSLAPETDQVVRLMVGNLVDARRLVNLSYEVSGDEGDFTVRGPASLMVPARQWRNYSITIRSSATGLQAQSAVLEVRGLIPETGEVAFATAQMVRGVVLGPEANRLTLQVAPYSDGVNSNCVNTERCSQAFLDAIDVAPGAVKDAWVSVDLAPESGASFGAFTTERLAVPVAFDPHGVLRFEVRTALEPVGLDEVTVDAVLSALDATTSTLTTIGTGSIERTLPSEPDTFLLTAPIRTNGPAVVPAGHYLLLTLAFRASDETQREAHNALQELRIQGTQSRITLPLVTVPEEYILKPSPSPFQVSVLGETEEFVNPGRSRLFNLSVTNIDASDQRLKTFAETQHGWPVSVLPGQEFILTPGASVTLGVLVRAPTDVQEGARTTVTVNAAADDGSVRLQNLTLVVTSGTDLSDDEGRYAADPEDLRYQVTPTATTPSAGAAPGIITILSLAFCRRFRRRP